MASPRKRRERKAAALAAKEASEELEVKEEEPQIAPTVVAKAKKAAASILEDESMEADLEVQDLSSAPKESKKDKTQKKGKGRINLFNSNKED